MKDIPPTEGVQGSGSLYRPFVLAGRMSGDIPVDKRRKMFRITHNVMEDSYVGCIGDCDIDGVWRTGADNYLRADWVGNILFTKRRQG